MGGGGRERGVTLSPYQGAPPTPTDEEIAAALAESREIGRELASRPRTSGVAVPAEHADVVALRLALTTQRTRIDRLERAMLELAAATGNTDVVLLLREAP